MEREELITLLGAQDGEYRKSGDSAGKYENYSSPGYSSYSPGGAQSYSGGGGGGGLLSLLGAGLSALGSSVMDDAMAQEAAQSVPESSYQQAYQQAVDKLESARQTSDVLPEVQADKLPGQATGGVDKIYSDRIDITKDYPEVQEWIQMSGAGYDRMPSVQSDKIESRARSGELFQDRIDITKEYPEAQRYEEPSEIRTVSQDALRREAQKWNTDNGIQTTDYSAQSTNRSFWDSASEFGSKVLDNFNSTMKSFGDSAKDVGGKILDQVTETMEWHHTPQGILSDLGAYVLAGPVIAAGSALAGGAALTGAAAAPAAASNVISLSAYKAAGAVAGAGAVVGNLASAAAQGNGAVSGSQINSWNPQTKTYSSGTTLNTLKQAAMSSAIKAQTTQSKLNSAISTSKSQPVQMSKLTGGGTGSW
jgi:hypothetical protein